MSINLTNIDKLRSKDANQYNLSSSFVSRLTEDKLIISLIPSNKQSEIAKIGIRSLISKEIFGSI